MSFRHWSFPFGGHSGTAVVTLESCAASPYALGRNAWLFLSSRVYVSRIFAMKPVEGTGRHSFFMFWAERRIVLKMSRPNRGGGRFNKSRTSHERKGMKKENPPRGGQKDEALGKRKEDIPAAGGSGTGNGVQVGRERTAALMRSQAPIQNFFMSAENQDMLLGLVRDLRGKEALECDGDSGFEHVHLDLRQLVRNESYWKRMGDQRLVIVDDSVGRSSNTNSESLEADIGDHSPYAVKKLLHCGFEKKRCLAALDCCNGDVGLALEQLLSGCSGQSSLGKASPFYDAEKLEDAKLQRAEEILALQSIYEDRFSETIPDSVWVMKFDLPFLKHELKPKVVKEKISMKKPVKLPANVCKFYVRGHCRFGDKCRMVHELKKESPPVEEIPDTPMEFLLEIRFPEGSMYPFEPPLVAFYCSDYTLSTPFMGFLNVALRLNKEAKLLCDSESPAVFSLIGILESEDEVLECFRKGPSDFSLPEDIHRHGRLTPGEADVDQANLEDSNAEQNLREKVGKASHINASMGNISGKAGNLGKKLQQQFQRMQVIQLKLLVVSMATHCIAHHQGTCYTGNHWRTTLTYLPRGREERGEEQNDQTQSASNCKCHTYSTCEHCKLSKKPLHYFVHWTANIAHWPALSHAQEYKHCLCTDPHYLAHWPALSQC